MGCWPASVAELIRAQLELAAARPAPFEPSGAEIIGACFVCFERGPSGPGLRGDRGWAAAVLGDTTAIVEGEADAPYEAGLLALREGHLLESAVRALPEPPGLLLVNATGRDHPRRAGLALHLGAVLGVPTVGVTHRTLLARGDWPTDMISGRSPLVLAGEVVGYWLRTGKGRRPVAVHAAWRTDAETAAAAVLACAGATRTPEPLRLARREARTARSRRTG